MYGHRLGHPEAMRATGNLDAFRMKPPRKKSRWSKYRTKMRPAKDAVRSEREARA